MSAVAALAVASPFAVVALSDLSGPAPQHREFKQAAVITDLPNELMSALQQGLSQFGINLPPLPVGLSPSGAQPITGSLLTNPGLATTGPTGLGTAPAPALAGLPAAPATSPTMPEAALNSPALTNPALSDPTTTGPLATPASTPGLTTPPVTDPTLNPPPVPVPTGLGAPNGQAIGAPVGLDPLGGTYPTYPIDPSLAGPLPSTGGGGLVSDISSAAQQLGVGQAIDLLKGVVMPSITSAIQSAAPAAQAAVPPPPAG